MFNSFESMSETVFYQPGYQFAVRLILGALGAVYLFFLPEPFFLLGQVQIVALLLFYFLFHILWWFNFKKRGVTPGGIRLANWVDLAAGGIMVIADPYPVPATLLLVFIAVLGNGFQHGLANFVIVAQNAFLVIIVAIPVHFLLLKHPPPYQFYFYLGFLVISTLYAHALVRRIEELKNRAEALAQTDELTGLMNRRAFMQSARYLISLYKRTRLALVFIYADLDDFKAINDRLGHETGDQVLKGFADLVRLNFRKTDIASRYGGDEFIFILTDSTPENAAKVMERMEREFIAWGRSLGMGVDISWGLKAVLEEEAHLETILRESDQALYRAKKQKRGT